jgi:hypothetical protein
MERIYYPSMRRVILFIYAAPVVVVGIGFVVTATIQLIRGEEIHFNWEFFTSFTVVWIGMRLLSDGLRAERLAIKITPTAISGPIAVGRAEPIPLNEIDFQRTFNQNLFARTFLTRRVYSLAGDQVLFHELLFQPRHVSEIWSIIENAQRQRI